MAEFVDDTKNIFIQVLSTGDIIVSDIQAPSYVELNTPFTINYTVKNKASAKTIYGVLINTVLGYSLFQSFWTDTFTGNKTVTYTVQRGTTANMDIQIQIGVI